jgi:hypothetical protein
MKDELFKDLNSLGDISNRAKLATMLTRLGYERVVHCWECKKWDSTVDVLGGEGPNCYWMGRNREGFDYCSEGEPKAVKPSE